MSKPYKRKDHLYNQAKAEGFRSRAAYKLRELHTRYGLLKPGMKVLDLGAWPGGWLQVAAEYVGSRGKVIGIDLAPLDALDDPQIIFFQGDAAEEALIRQALAAAGGPFDLLLSDMSPKLSGVKDVDDMAVAGCGEIAIAAAGLALRQGGAFVAKIFKGNETETFVKNIRPLFNKLTRNELKSTRSSSNEFYVVGFGYKGGATVDAA